MWPHALLRFALVLLFGALQLMLAAVPVQEPAPRLRFTLVRTYSDAWLPDREAWSPDGEHFVITGIGRFGFASIRDSGSTTNSWYPHSLQQPAWSPRGDVLAFAVARGTRPEMWDDFVAGPAGEPELLDRGAGNHELLWLDDGTLCRWWGPEGAMEPLVTDSAHARAGGRRSAVLAAQATAAWESGESRLLVAHATAGIEGRGSSASVRGWSTRSVKPPVTLRLLARNRARGLTLAVGGTSRWEVVLLDSGGNIVRVARPTRGPLKLRRMAFSPDGNFLLGVEAWYGDEEEPAPSRLRAEALDGSWQTSVDGAPTCDVVASSDRDGWVLLADYSTHSVHLGRLEVVQESWPRAQRVP